MCDLSYYSKHEEAKYPACSLFLSFSSGGRLWIDVCWIQVLILKYFCMDCIPPILLKHLDWSLMSILVWVSLSECIARMKLWKPVLDLAVSNDTLVINTKNFPSYFCSIFVICKIPQHYMLNMNFQFLRFRGIRP